MERSGAKWSEVERSGTKWSGSECATGVAPVAPGWGPGCHYRPFLCNACTTMALPVPPWHMAFGSKMSGNRLSVLFQCYSSVGGVVATNLERTGFGMSIGMGMGIGDSGPAPILEAKKKRKRKGMDTRTPTQSARGLA